MKAITIRFDKDVYEKITKEAKKTKRSFNAMVNVLCSKKDNKEDEK